MVDELYARYGGYHWVHAINNTALVAAALVAFDGDFSAGICGVVQGGWDTDTNGAAVGSILGALAPIEERWSAPLHGRFASSLPGFDGITLDELTPSHARGRMLTVEAPRDPLVPRPIDLWTAVPLEPGAPLDALDTAKILAAPDDPADWPAWREALRRWRDEAAARIGYDGSAYERPALAWTQSCFAVALVWLWDELLYDHVARRASRPTASAPSPSASSAASTGSCSGTPTR